MVAAIHAGRVLAPLLIDPRRPGASTSIHVELGSTGEQIAIT